MDFNTWKEFYGWGFCTIAQLQQAVKQNMLTNIQYKDITGQDYPVVKIPIEAKPITIEPEAKQPSASKEDIVPEQKTEHNKEDITIPESKPESFLQKILNV